MSLSQLLNDPLKKLVKEIFSVVSIFLQIPLIP